MAVPSEHGEDEVMAVLALVPGARLDPAELIEFLRPRMAHFMIPRYVRIVAELPKTPTAEGGEAPPARRRRDAGHLGPRGGRHPRAAREDWRGLS